MKGKRLVANARTLQWLSLGLILLLGTALRLYRLGRPSLWGDEINVAVASMGSIRQVLEGARSHVSAPPLPYLIVHLLATYAGTSEFSLCFGAAVWGILSILALADGHRGLGQTEEAADLYRKVLALQPGNQRASEGLRALQP